MFHRKFNMQSSWQMKKWKSLYIWQCVYWCFYELVRKVRKRSNGNHNLSGENVQIHNNNQTKFECSVTGIKQNVFSRCK